ncbi:MAG: beta-eliminating lyase-related protein [Ilumatobacteraceae bacterium]
MDRPIELRSDNAAGVAPEILAAVAAADEGSALAYGADEWSARLRERVADVFERRDVTVFPVVSGTAANALGLSALCPPWGAVLCHESAHILNSEGGATSLLGGGAVMRGLSGPSFRLTPEAVTAALDGTRWGDPHHSQPAVVSLTCPTDHGTSYTPAEVGAIAAVAHDRSLRVHVDGARIANTIAALGCTPAELTWRAGVDVLSLGATKNGALSTDAIVCFDDSAAAELVYRTKRAGHVASKMRFQSAQLDAYLADGLWLRLAATANRSMAVLAAGLRELDVELLNEPDVNMVFARLPDAAARRLERADVRFYDVGGGVVRFVTSFQTTDADARDALERIRGALAR